MNTTLTVAQLKELLRHVPDDHTVWALVPAVPQDPFIPATHVTHDKRARSVTIWVGSDV